MELKLRLLKSASSPDECGCASCQASSARPSSSMALLSRIERYLRSAGVAPAKADPAPSVEQAIKSIPRILEQTPIIVAPTEPRALGAWDFFDTGESGPAPAPPSMADAISKSRSSTSLETKPANPSAQPLDTTDMFAVIRSQNREKSNDR